MRPKKSEEVAKRVCQKYENFFSRDRKKTRDHFILENMHRKSINLILDRYEERGNADYKKSCGRPVLLRSKKVACLRWKWGGIKTAKFIKDTELVTLPEGVHYEATDALYQKQGCFFSGLIWLRHIMPKLWRTTSGRKKNDFVEKRQRFQMYLKRDQLKIFGL